MSSDSYNPDVLSCIANLSSDEVFFDEKTETWYFSVTDVVGALTESTNPAVY